MGYIFCNNVDVRFPRDSLVVNIEGCPLFRALPFTRDSTRRYWKAEISLGMARSLLMEALTGGGVGGRGSSLPANTTKTVNSVFSDTVYPGTTKMFTRSYLLDVDLRGCKLLCCYGWILTDQISL